MAVNRDGQAIPGAVRIVATQVVAVDSTPTQIAATAEDTRACKVVCTAATYIDVDSTVDSTSFLMAIDEPHVWDMGKTDRKLWVTGETDSINGLMHVAEVG